MVASLHRSNLQESPSAHSIAPTLLPHVIGFKKHMKTGSAPASVDLNPFIPTNNDILVKLLLQHRVQAGSILFLIYLSN